MTLARRFSLVLCLVVCAVRVPAATALTNLVNDHAALVVAVHDAPGLIAAWGQSPWAKTWNDEQVKKFLAPARKKMKVEDWNNLTREKTGYTLDELMSFATGDAILALQDFSFAFETPEKTPPLLFGIEVGDNGSKIEALLAKEVKEGKATEETSDFSGVTVHTMHTTENNKPDGEAIVWAIVEGKWLISPVKEVVLSAIDNVKNGGVENAWGRSERYAQMQRRTGDAHVTFVLNVEAVYPAVKAAIEAKQKAAADKQAGPFNFDQTALLTALGLDTWREIYGAVRLNENSTDSFFGLTYTEARGLMKVLAYKDGPPPMPAFVSANWVTAVTAKFSVKEAWASLEEILENFNPAISGMVQGQIRGMNKQLNIDLKRDLIGSLGDTLVTANIRPSTQGNAKGIPQFEQLIALSLGNQDVFTNAIGAIKASMGPQADTMFVPRDYLGQKIYTFKNPSPQGKGFSYAIAKGYFLLGIGSAAPVEAALQGLAGDQPKVWDKPEVAAAFSQLPANVSEFEYQDLRAMIGMVIQAFSSTASMMAHTPPPPAEDADADGKDDTKPTPAGQRDLPFDPTALPDADAIGKYWGYGWGFVLRDNSGLHGTHHVIYPK